MQERSHATLPNTQDTIHLKQGRTTTSSGQSRTRCQRTPDGDIDLIIGDLTGAFKALHGPSPTNSPSTQGKVTTSTGSIAELPGNDTMLLSINKIFSAVDTAVVQCI